MKKIVVEVSLSSTKSKSSIMTTVAKLNGIKSIKLDEKLGRLVIVGTADPVDIIEALRKKNKNAKLVSVGPPEQEESRRIQPYNYWSDSWKPVYPYQNWNDSYSYKPVLYQYPSVPYEEQPSGCVII